MFLLAAAGQSSAQTAISGYAEHLPDSGEVWMVSDIRNTADNTLMYGGTGKYYCFEFNATAPAVGANSYVAYDEVTSAFFRRGSTLSTANLLQAQGMIAWIFDNYYDSYGLSQNLMSRSYEVNQGMAPVMINAELPGFHRAIWEIQTDFANGDLATLDTGTGKQITTGYLPSSTNPYMWDSAQIAMEILNAMKTANTQEYYGTYESSRFQFVYLDKTGAQNGLLVIDNQAVPEPSVFALTGALGAIVAIRRRRA